VIVGVAVCVGVFVDVGVVVTVGVMVDVGVALAVGVLVLVGVVVNVGVVLGVGVTVGVPHSETSMTIRGSLYCLWPIPPSTIRRWSSRPGAPALRYTTMPWELPVPMSKPFGPKAPVQTPGCGARGGEGGPVPPP